SSRRRHTSFSRDWSSDVCSSDLGGLPDRDGIVSLDACIMDENGNCGAVAFLEGIKNPISVARLVMEKTPHIFLVGKGAQDFALTNGFKLENLLTEKAKERWLMQNLGRLYLLKIYVDRKSTRLNSSHVKISYAVFCS